MFEFYSYLFKNGLTTPSLYGMFDISQIFCSIVFLILNKIRSSFQFMNKPCMLDLMILQIHIKASIYTTLYVLSIYASNWFGTHIL